MYEWLGESDVETHVYGIDGSQTTVVDLDVAVHRNTTAAYRHAWVLVFRAPEKTTLFVSSFSD